MNSTPDTRIDPCDRAVPEARGQPDDGSALPVAADALAMLPDAATRVLRRFRIVFNAVKSHFR